MGGKKTFKGIEDITKILYRQTIFDMQNGITVKQSFALSCELPFQVEFLSQVEKFRIGNCENRFESVDMICEISRARNN